ALGMQTVIDSSTRRLWPLALLFGCLHGLRSGADVAGTLSLAGSHTVVALAAASVATAVAGVWVTGLTRLAAPTFASWMPTPRVTAIVVAVIAIHAGLHGLLDGATALRALQPPS